jgi:carbonic anhydrase
VQHQVAGTRVIGDGAFDDLFETNRRFVEGFHGTGLPARAAKGLAVITCMDSRVDPFGILGIQAGDAKILRNAGARVTDDVLRTLVLAVYLLDVRRVLVMPHTRCRMAESTDDEIHRLIHDEYGVDTRSLDFGTDPDQLAMLRKDLVKIRAAPLLPRDLIVGGAVFDVDTGRLVPVPLDQPRG